MSLQALKGLFKQAERALASRSEAQLLEAFDARYRDPETFLDAVRVFVECQFYRDAGFKTLGGYAAAVIPNCRRNEWNGWAALSGLQPPPEIFALIKSGALKLDRLGQLVGILNQGTYKSWLFLALHLSRKEMGSAARSYKRMMRGRLTSEAVIFVPTWVPVSQHRRRNNGEFDETDPK